MMLVKTLRAILCFAMLLTFVTGAVAQVSPAPQPSPSPQEPGKAGVAPKAKPAASAKRPAAPPQPSAAPATSTEPTAAPDDPNADLVYGAYQRGFYKTAFDLATKRAQENSDPKAMTMLGELYANAMGIKRDDAKAAEWYKRAADRGDREAMFELAMLR